MKSHQVINIDTLISMVGNDSAFQKAIIRKFIDKEKEIKTDLYHSINTKDWDAIESISHKFKSSSSAVGAESIAYCFYEIEKAAKLEDEAMIDACKSELFAEFEKLKEFVEVS